MTANFRPVSALAPRMIVLVLVLVTLLAMAPVPFASAQENGVVARVNGTDITEADLAVIEEIYAEQLATLPQDARRSVLVDELIQLRLVGDAARRAGIDQQDAYKKRMAFFEGQTLRNLYIDQQVAAAVTDEKVRTAYEEQVANMPQVEEVRLRHILLPTKAAADEAIAALKAGKDFAEFAREKSEDPASKDEGGDLGFVVAGQTIAEVDAAAATLQPGQVSETPVKSPFGFHVVKVDERRNRPAPPFETTSAQLRQSLEAAEGSRVVAELRAAAKVEKLVPDVQPPGSEEGDQH